MSTSILSIIIVTLLIGSFGIYQESFAITANEINEKIKFNESFTRPTFGLSHESDSKIVDYGFSFNNQTNSITNNFHTPFAEQLVKIGKINSFEAKVYAEHGLKVQEFLFGIPQKGDAHLAELGIEVGYGLFGEIETIKVIQKSKVIDKDSIVVTHTKTKCQTKDIETNCDTTYISMIFLEPLKDKVMAIKAIDHKNRYQITYLNEGITVLGEQITPLQTMMIPSTIKYEGLIPVTQTEKYSDYWIAKDGRMFKKNDFDSFAQVNYTFERFQDNGEPRTRHHSGFGGIIAYEEHRATKVFNSSKLVSELPDSFTLDMSISERMSNNHKAAMLWQELLARQILEDAQIQARWH